MVKSSIKLHKGLSIKLSIIYTLLLLLWLFIAELLNIIPEDGLFSAGVLQVLFGLPFIGIVLWLNYIFIFKGILKIKNLESRLYHNEEMYRYVINNTTLGLWTYNIETGEYVFPPKWKSYLGYTESEITSDLKSWKGLIHPYDLGRLQLLYKDYLNKMVDKFEIEYRIRKKNGEWLWVLAHGAGIWKSNGELVKLLVTHTDVTANKNNERFIKESEEKFRTLFNSASDAIVLVEYDGAYSSQILEVNEITIKRYGFQKEELIKMTPFDIIADSERNKVKKHFKEIMEKKRDSFETLLRTKDGELVPVEINDHLFTMNGKNVVLSIVRDITERKEAEIRLQEMITENEVLLKRAIENERIKSEFFCNISHEFRTPLNIILGIVQLFESNMKSLSEHLKNSSYENYIRILKQNCYRLLRLINNILEINKIDAHYSELDLKNHNIINLIEEIALSVTDFINNRGLSIIFDTDIEERIIACDEYKIERIILNLISNSIKYSKPDTVIYVNIINPKDYVIISIKDTGIGIQKEKIDTIFDRFTQVDSSLTRRCEGSGIGLSIVKSYIEMHHGEIWVESEYGIGTEFFIKLPARVVGESNEDKCRDIDSSIIERVNIEFSDIYNR